MKRRNCRHSHKSGNFTNHSSSGFKQLPPSGRERDFGRRGADYSERPRETHCLKSLEKDLMKAEAFRRYAMNNSRWRNVGIAGVACLVVIGVVAGSRSVLQWA